MATGKNTDRYEQLMSWMKDRDISFPALAERLGVSAGAIRAAVQGETCPTAHHGKMIALGFPAELLPVPMDKPRGRKRKEPRFPALTNDIKVEAGMHTPPASHAF